MRVERPARNFEAVVSFYRDVVGLPVLASFEDHDGYSGVVFGLTDASRQLELVFHEEQQPAPTSSDQLVFYLGSAERVT
ncbi:MAG TPA: VOC family protein, partial [Gaiellaceae bacterium]